MRITITRNRPYDLVVNIKQPQSTTIAELPVDAVATFYIISKSDNKLLVKKQMTRLDTDPDDPLNEPTEARFRLDLTAEDTAALPYEIEYAEDGTKFRDTCRGHITVDSPSSANDQIKYADAIIPHIYVADLGEEVND